MIASGLLAGPRPAPYAPRMQIQSIGPYRVIRLLGEGGMGMVYEAIRDDIGARAAVKVLRPEFARNADAASRFFNEICVTFF